MNTVRPPADEPQVLLESGASSQDLAIRELTALTDPGAKGASAGWRRIPVGAEVTARGVNFRVWAPERRQVEVVLAEGLERLTPIALDPEADGYFSATVENGPRRYPLLVPPGRRGRPAP
jgi:hypothetical protein